MNEQTWTRIPLPSEITGAELMKVFRDASTFQQNEDVRWEYGADEFTPGVWVGGHHYFRVFARPLFRQIPSKFQRHVLGNRSNSWKPRHRVMVIGDSEAAVILTGRRHQWEVDAESSCWEVFLAVHLKIERNGAYLETDDLDHPAFREYREGFERIRANLLTKLIDRAKRDAVALAAAS